jgi:hypothetical protein
MSSPLGDTAHDLFWQQLLRWLAGDSPGPVQVTMPQTILMDDGHVKMTAAVRDKTFTPAPDAKVMAHVMGPQGESAMVDLAPVANQPGMYEADWTAQKPGSYVAEVTAGSSGSGPHPSRPAMNGAPTEYGKDVVAFRREDGVAENFHTEQNKALLQKLSEETGGRYWSPSELANLPKDISYSEAGISVRDTKELWDMPAVFFVLLALMAGDWLLRRKWGVV